MECKEEAHLTQRHVSETSPVKRLNSEASVDKG